MDILLTMILIKLIYERWQPEILKPVVRISDPVIDLVTARLSKWIMYTTHRTFSRKTILVLLVVSMSLIRFLIIKIS